ncbi:hypothetical protein D3C80_1152800 [compost metagenome]
MVVPVRPGPDGGHRHDVREVERGDRRRPHIGVDVSGQATEPGFDGVQALCDAGEITLLHDLFGLPEFGVGDRRILVPHRQGGGDQGVAHPIGAEILQSLIGVRRLVASVGVHQDGRLIGHHLLEEGCDGFPLGEPLAADAAEQASGVGFVQADRARGPAVVEGQTIELVEEPGPGRCRETNDGQDPQMRLPQTRSQAADQSLVGQQHINVHRRFRQTHGMPRGRDRGVEEGQGRCVVEPGRLRHKTFDQGEEPICPIDEAADLGRPVHTLLCVALVEPSRGAAAIFSRRQPDQGQVVGAFEMGSVRLEVSAPLLIHQA